jgi:hypothetical protein
MCDFPVDGVEPDLIFYYDVITGIESIIIDTDDLKKSETQNAVFIDKKLKHKIGDYTFTFSHTKKNNLVFVNFLFFLDNPKGGFTCSNASRPYKVPNRIDTNSYTIFTITSGYYNYLDAKGFVYIKTDCTSIRTVYVYFTKCIK